jgi:hypothetical protein
MERYLIPRRMSFLALGGFLALALFLHGSAIPAKRIINHLPLFCPFELVTSIPCPGCGMTHALFSMAQGNIGDAWLFNPFSFFFILLLGMSCLPRGYVKSQSRRTALLMRILFVVALISLLYYWIVFRVMGLL